MTRNILKIFLLLFFLIIGLICESHLTAAQPTEVPIIRIDEPNHTFPTVFEGEELSHTFAVSNIGTTNLNIKSVTPS